MSIIRSKKLPLALAVLACGGLALVLSQRVRKQDQVPPNLNASGVVDPTGWSVEVPTASESGLAQTPQVETLSDIPQSTPREDLLVAFSSMLANATGTTSDQIAKYESEIKQHLESLLTENSLESLDNLVQAMLAMPPDAVHSDLARNQAARLLSDLLLLHAELISPAHGTFVTSQDPNVQAMLGLGLNCCLGFSMEMAAVNANSVPGVNSIPGFEYDLFEVASRSTDAHLRTALLVNMTRSLNYDVINRALDQLLQGPEEDLFLAGRVMRMVLLQENFVKRNPAVTTPESVGDSSVVLGDRLITAARFRSVSQDEFVTLANGLMDMGQHYRVQELIEAVTASSDLSAEFLTAFQEQMPPR